MTPYPVQCFEHNGEPYGRYILPEYFEHSFLMIGWSSPSSFINANTFPMPGAEIGKTYERDEVEVVEQYYYIHWHDGNKLICDALRQKGEIPVRQIFRLVISKRETTTQPVEKEPETVEQAARIESLNNSYNNRVSKEISTGDAISTLDEANGYNKGFYDGWKSALAWQKKQEGK